MDDDGTDGHNRFSGDPDQNMIIPLEIVHFFNKVVADPNEIVETEEHPLALFIDKNETPLLNNEDF